MNGVEKYKINWLTCYKLRPYVADHWVNCLTCVTICPYTKPATWWHALATQTLRRSPPPLRPTVVRGLKWLDDRILGRGAEKTGALARLRQRCQAGRACSHRRRLHGIARRGREDDDRARRHRLLCTVERKHQPLLQAGLAMFKIPSFTGRDRNDPYWGAFVRKAPADPNSLVAEAIRRHPEGAVYPVTSDVHSPAVMSQHIKEFAGFLGADLCGIATAGVDGYPYAIVCGFFGPYDPETSAGIGGQAAVLNGVYATFNIAAWIRECGYRATVDRDGGREQQAERAGLVTLDGDGRVKRPRPGRHLYLADVLLTDLPVAPENGGGA